MYVVSKSLQPPASHISESLGHALSHSSTLFMSHLVWGKCFLANFAIYNLKTFTNMYVVSKSLKPPWLVNTS